jgi:hypothetical protein
MGAQCAGGVVIDEVSRFTKAIQNQHMAFEQYVEARMAFAEHQLDGYTRGARSPGPGPVFPVYKRTICALAVALLCATAFSVGREQRHVGSLEASRDEMSNTLSQTRTRLQMLERKVDALTEARQTAAVAPAPVVTVQHTRTQRPGSDNRKHALSGPIKPAKPANPRAHPRIDPRYRLYGKTDGNTRNRYESTLPHAGQNNRWYAAPN